MTLLDRHVLATWLKTFGLIMAALLGLLVMVDMQRNLADFIGSGAGIWEVLYYYLVLVPGNVPLVLQIAVLLSLLYALGQLHRNNEFTAMRAAGLGLFRVTRSVWLFGLLLAGFVWYLNASMIPWSVEEARETREQMRRAADLRKRGNSGAGVYTALAYANDAAGRLWFINSYDDIARRGQGVSVGFFDANRHELRRLIAREGYYDRWRGAWVFVDGRELNFDPQTGEQLATVPFAHRIEEKVDDDPELMLLLLKNAADLSLFELDRVMASLPDGDTARFRRYAVEHKRKQASPFGVLVVIALAVPFAMGGVRVNPAVNMSKSIGLFFLYFLLSKLATLMASFGTLTPFTAAWLPDTAMALIAVIAFVRLR
ncbi:MAG: LptF/LptG family permease [Opitutaceae bacterium]